MKRASKAFLKALERLRARCARCRESMMVHGGPAPHTRYDDNGNVLCAGFTPPGETPSTGTGPGKGAG